MGYQGQARSSKEGWGFNPMAVIQWISMLQDVYEKFDYNDVECQKRLICEVLKEEEYFGDVSRNLKSGFELVKYLEVMNLPDEFRELLDESMYSSSSSPMSSGSCWMSTWTPARDLSARSSAR